MHPLNVKLLIDDGSLRRIHLRIFLCCLVSLTFEGYDLVVYGATLPLLMREWHMTRGLCRRHRQFRLRVCNRGRHRGRLDGRHLGP